jgi:hypothetical protein
MNTDEINQQKAAATEGTSLFGMQVNALRLNTARQTAGEQRQSGRTTGLLLQALGNAVMSPGSEVEFKDHAPHSSTIGALLLAAQLQAMADALGLKVAARNHVCSVFVTSLHEPPSASDRAKLGTGPLTGPFCGDFGWALRQLKAGSHVARRGWNGKGMYLWLLPATTVKAEWCKEPHLKQLAEANGGSIEALGSIRMMTADKKVLTGWLASQTDMLAEDWVLVE